MNRIVIKSRNKAQTPSSLREWLMAQSLTQDPNDEVYYGVDTYVGVVRVKMLLKDIDKVCSIRTLKRLHGPIAQNFQMIPIDTHTYKYILVIDPQTFEIRKAQ